MPEEMQPLIGLYENRPAACRKYDPRAAEVARRIIDLISSRQPRFCAEHIGSTSVPGCAGKGIVDLMIPVPPGEMDEVKRLLEQLGFQPQTGDDPFPEDRPMRVGSYEHEGEIFLLHVHAIPADSPEIEEIRFFRVCLKSDPDLMKAYVSQKKKIIAAGITDSLAYCRAKGEFLKTVLG
jgi:GrpB-like predicted nucleotidyltransferase (UPF0157 family)